MTDLINWVNAISSMGIVSILILVIISMATVIKVMYKILTSLNIKYEKCRDELLEEVKKS